MVWSEEREKAVRVEMLRLRQIRDACRLVNSCLQVGGDPNNWRTRLAEGAHELFGARVVIAAELQDIWDDEIAGILQVLEVGWSSETERAKFIEFMVSGAVRRDVARQHLRKRRGPFVVTSIGAMMPFEEYRATEVYRQYMEPCGLGDQLISIVQISGSESRRWNLLTCHAAAGAPLFTADQRRLMRFLLSELAPLIGTRLADATDPIMKFDSPPARSPTPRTSRHV